MRGRVCRGFVALSAGLTAPLAPAVRACRSSDVSGHSAERARAARSRDPRAGSGSRKLSVPDRHERRADVEQIAACAALCTPPMPTTGIATRAATAATWASATARIAGPDSPPVPPPSHGVAPALAARARRERHRAQRVDQRDGVGAALLRPPARRPATSAVFGVSLTISGLRVLAAHRAHDLLAAARDRRRCRGPVCTFGQDTFSSIAAISARCVAGLARARASSAARRAHHVRDQRHRQRRASSRQVLGRGSPSRPLLGRPIELISPAGASHSRGGGLPARGSSVIVLETNAANGNPRSSAVAERARARRSRRTCPSR